MLAGDDKEKYRPSFHGSAFCVSVFARFCQEPDINHAQFLQCRNHAANHFESDFLAGKDMNSAVGLTLFVLIQPKLQLSHVGIVLAVHVDCPIAVDGELGAAWRSGARRG